MWCELCHDRIIDATVKVCGVSLDICKSCASMVIIDKEEN